MSWEIKKLDEIVYVKSGKRLPKGHSFIEEKTNFEYIRARDIKNGKIKIESPVYISEETYNKISKYTVSENDVVITIVGANVGDIAIINSNYNGANLTENAAKLIPKNKTILSPRFLKYSLFGDNQKSKFQQIAMAAAQPKLGFYKIKDFEIGLPAIEIQKRIASILSAYDDLIENNLKRIKLLEQAAQNIYKEWFVNMRFPDHENIPVDQETGLPEGWSISKYKNHFNVLTGKKDANHSNENGKYPFFTCGKTIIKSLDYSFDCEAILLAGNGDFNVKYYRGKFQAYQRTYVLSPHKSEELFLIFIHLDTNLKHLTHGSKGSVIKYLTKGMVENVEFVLPDNSILHRFNNLCLNIFSKIENLKLQNQKLKSARDILLPRLMNQTIEV